jgi:flagellar hook-associated protein 1 FlgK
VSNLTADQIAAALPGAPGGNGNAIALARLASAQTIGGYTFTQYFGTLGSRVGRDVAAAKEDKDAYQGQLAQARAVRATQTGVSLDEEATHLMQFQQAYQAAGKLLTVLDTLTQSVIDLIH